MIGSSHSNRRERLGGMMEDVFCLGLMETVFSLLELLTELEEAAYGRRFYLLEGFRYLLKGFDRHMGDQIRRAYFLQEKHSCGEDMIGFLSGRLDEDFLEE